MKNTSIVWRMVVAIGIAVFFAACSDGELQLGNNLNIAPPAPVILKFVADPAEVKVGDFTTLYWEVEVADSIEISSAPEGLLNFHAGPFEDLSGSTRVDDLTETTEFILTASKTVMAVVPASGDESAPSDENPATPAIVIEKAGQIPLPGEPPVPSTSPVTSSAQKSVTVTVVASQECSVDITSDSGSAPINAGDSTTIRWTATPGDVPVTVTASDGTPVADSFPAVGNATVTPDSTTTYTARAVCPDGQEKNDSVTVTVSEQDIEPNIKANDEEDLVTIPNFTNGVNITYSVTPENALVKVGADKEVNCTPELPAEFVALTDGTGTPSLCTLTGDTTFTITAKIGDRDETDKVKVVLQGGQTADAKISAPPWAFEGETVKITADPDAIEGNNRELIKEIKVAGKVYPLPATGPLVVGEALVPSGGIDVTVVSVSDVEISHPKVVQAVTPITMLPTENVEEFSRIVLDAANPELAYVGVKRPGYCQNNTCGHVSAYKSNIKNVSEYSAMDIDIATELLATGDYWKTGDDNVKGKAFFEMVKDYPVSAIAVDESRIFVGTTGLLVYSEDNGATWKKITTFLRFNADDHKTCAGETQTGNGDILGSLGRACDLIAQDNHLIIATDRGVLTLKDVDSFATSADSSLFMGRPPAGSIPSSPEYLTYGAVANDLEATDDAVYVASEKGLFKTSDNGETWEKIDGIDDELFSVAVDKIDNKIYVGTGTGVKSRSLTDGGTWQPKELAQKVYSLAVDPYQAGVVLAGTSSGLYVTRDKGESWTSVGAGGFEGKAVKSVVIAGKVVDAATNQIQYSISFGGMGGAVADSITVGIVAPAPVPEDDSGDETGDETGGTDDGTTGDVTGDTTGDTTGGDVEPSLAIRAYNRITMFFAPLIGD